MATRRTWNWDRLLAVGAAGLLLMLVPACAVNRRMVRIQTQVQLLNDSLAGRQQRMDQDFEVTAQLIEQNKNSLEAVSEKVRKMQQTVVHSEGTEAFARLARQIERLQRSAQELNGTMAEINSRAEVMNDQLQYSMRRPSAASEQPDRYQSSNDNPVVKPNHGQSYTGRVIDLPEEKTQ